MKLADRLWRVGVVVVAGCWTSSPAPTAKPVMVADPTDPAMPVLRTGATTIAEGETIDAKVVSHFVGKELETVRLDLSGRGCMSGAMDHDEMVTADLGPGRAHAHGVVRTKVTASSHDDVLIARPRELAGQPITGDVYVPSGCRLTGVHFKYSAPASTSAPLDPQLPIAWANELGEQIGTSGGWQHTDAWHAFARARLVQLGGGSAASRSQVVAPSPDELSRLMETTTGVDALQEALQADRALLVGSQQTKPTIAISTVHGPELASHPWAEMRKALGRAAPEEPLAAETPAEFYYLRFASVSALFRILDQADAWASPILSLLDGRSEQRALAERYQTQLGLERSELARAFGDRVVSELAVVGSDPYFGEGTDVTLLFRITSKAAFGATLATALGKHGAAHGGIATTAVGFHGSAINVARSADGAVHRYRAQLGAIEIVSNSLGAIERVLDTHATRHPSLASEPDFQYALARGADVRADVLAFLGDRFVGAVVGPSQKIQETRRQVALAELSTPPYASLLYGWIYGRSPKSTDELIAAGLLGGDELVHHDGAAIAWHPGAAPTSSWGTPSAMTPLIDLPEITTVTPAERDAYARFVSTYQTYWKRYIDPIAIRVAITPDALAIDTRVLPLIDASEYQSLAMVVGSSRVTAPPIAAGARVTLGIGEQAVSEASRGLRSMLRDLPDLKWLGDWATVGVEDRPQVAAAVLAEREIPQKPDPGSTTYRSLDRNPMLHLPAYAAIGIRDRTAAALFMVGLRKFAEDAAPGVLTWGEVSRVHDVAIVRVAAKDDSLNGLAVYYAFVKAALVISLDEHTIGRQVTALVEGHGPGGVPATTPGAPQIVLDLAGAGGGPLWHTAAWMLEQPARVAGERSIVTAEALFNGAPELGGNSEQLRQLALQIFGAAPLTADGRPYVLGPEGVRDPVRGNRFAPAWPDLPVADSPIAKLLGALSRARCEISFDTEPTTAKPAPQSLHIKLTLGMR